LASSTTFRVRDSASPFGKAWVARFALFRAPLGPAAGVLDCSVLNLLVAVFPLFYQERNTD